MDKKFDIWQQNYDFIAKEIKKKMSTNKICGAHISSYMTYLKEAEAEGVKMDIARGRFYPASAREWKLVEKIIRSRDGVESYGKEFVREVLEEQKNNPLISRLIYARKCGVETDKNHKHVGLNNVIDDALKEIERRANDDDYERE